MSDTVRSATVSSDQTNDSAPAPLPPAAPPPPVVVDPNAVGTVEQWEAFLRLGTTTSLRREIRLKRLAASKRLGRLWIVGRAILDWLGGASSAPHVPRKAGRNGAAAQG